MMLSVSEQVMVFLSTALCGMAIALVYDIFRIFRKAVRTGSLVTFVQDILYWIIASVIMFVTIYYSNDGELRGFLFLGAFLGVVLYAFTFSRIIMNSSLLIIKIVTRVIKFTAFLISYPFRITTKLLIIPSLMLVKTAVKSAKEAGAARRAGDAGKADAAERDGAAEKDSVVERDSAAVRKDSAAKGGSAGKIPGGFWKRLRKAGNNKELKQ